MPIADQLLVLVHLVGFAGLLGGCLAQVPSSAPEVNLAMLWGAWLQILSGLALFTLAELGPDPVNHVKLGIKLVIAAVVLLLVAKNRKFTDIPRGLLALIGGLTFAAAALAVLWP